jgi:hypothetical protein
MADDPFPPAVLLPRRDSAGRDVAHGQPAMGGRRGWILLESAAEVSQGLGV